MEKDVHVTAAIIATHVAPAKGFGGIAECVTRQARAWAARNHSFRLVASDASTGPPVTARDLALPPSVPVHLYHAPRRSAWASRWGFGLGAITAIWSACAKADVVHIHGTGTWPTLLAKTFCLLLRRPMVITVHNGLMTSHMETIRAKKPVKWLIYRALVLVATRRAAALHVTSRLEEQGLDHWAPGVPVWILPNGVDSTAWLPLPWPDRFSTKVRGTNTGMPLTLCYLGRFSREKGTLGFLRLWKAARRPGDRLILAGSGTGAYADSVQAEIAAITHNYPGAITSLPYQDLKGVRAILRDSHLLVLPSGIEPGDLRENFGNVVIEAFSSARPVLVARGLAWDDVERDGTGFVFDPDVSSLTAALDRARAKDSDGLAAMGRAGRALAEGPYEMTTVGDALWTMVAEAATARATHTQESPTP